LEQRRYPEPFSHSTWKIQQEELFESAEHLNENHLPLELGDIFIKTGTDSQKRYILLAQPCDLMVRKNGKRQPEVVHVPLAEVAPASTPPAYAEKMAYFGDSPNESWYVKLKQIHQVHICLLDLCVFNKDGAATIDISGSYPDEMRPSWKERYKHLIQGFELLSGRLGVLRPSQDDSPDVRKSKEALKGELLNEGLFKGKLVEQNDRRAITYNCRRVGRLSRARSFGLLLAYTGCLSRPAYDRDLG